MLYEKNYKEFTYKVMYRVIIDHSELIDQFKINYSTIKIGYKLYRKIICYSYVNCASCNN